MVHVFTDGRDTAPDGGARFVRDLEAEIAAAGVGVVGSVVGRYWAMDRDERWERTEKAYRLLTTGEGASYADPAAFLEASYAAGVTDEFVEPGVLEGAGTRVEDGDAVVFFNFRSDRGRQLTRAFTEPGFDGFERAVVPDVHYVTMTSYSADFGVPVAFEKDDLEGVLGEVVADAGLTQLRAAETEKYPHVTFFFNGGREVQYPGEERVLVPSPKVATYDLQPEMSAPELSRRVAKAIREQAPDLVVLNFANPDMVGHTGVFPAAPSPPSRPSTPRPGPSSRPPSRAATPSRSWPTTATRTRCATRTDPPHTAHTTVPVPHAILGGGFEGGLRPGVLGDVAPDGPEADGPQRPALG